MTDEPRPDHPTRRDWRQPPPFPPRLGASIALPAFASLGVPRLLAAEDRGRRWPRPPRAPPLRAAFVYFPNGAIPASWWPSGEGTDFQFKRILAAARAAQGPGPGPGRPEPPDGRSAAPTAAATMRAATRRS